MIGAGRRLRRLCFRIRGAEGQQKHLSPLFHNPRSTRKLLLAAVVATIAACSDSPVTPNRWVDAPTTLKPRATVFPYVPGPKPGKFTVTMGPGDWAGRDTIAWPDTFATKTRVRLTVTGKLTRAYHTGIPGDWSNIAGTPYPNIDANGDYSLVNFQCGGGVFASFYHVSGGSNYVDGCAGVSTNTLGTTELDSFSTVGILRGTGKVFRLKGSQPIVPAPPYCSSTGIPRPCVVVTGGSQTITIERTNVWINLTATPDSVSEGDNIVFTVFTDPTTGLALITPESWTWVPDYVLDSAGTPIGAPPVAVAAPCTNVRVNTYKVTCTIPRTESGTMYVRADVGGGSGVGVEQASVHVKVTPVFLKASINRRFVGGGDSVKITLSSDPLSKPITSAAISGGTATLSGASCTGSVCRANVLTSGTIMISALVNGIAKNASVRVDTVHCATGDSTVDNLTVRELLAELDSLSQANNKTEYAGVAYVDSATGLFPRFKIDTNSANTCKTSHMPNNPPGTRLIVEVHTHPYAIGDSLTCRSPGLAANQYEVYGPGAHLGIASAGDWASATIHPGPKLIIDNTIVAKYSATVSTLSSTQTVGGVPQPVPSAAEFANQYTYFLRSNSGCTWP